MKASYSKDKQREGVYNIRIVGEGCDKLHPGEAVQITTRAGDLKTDAVGRKLWSGEDRDSGELCALYAKAGEQAATTQDGQVAELLKRIEALEAFVGIKGAARPAARQPANQPSPPPSSNDDDLPF